MKDDAHVLAIKILAFSTRLGQLVPIDLSRMKPVCDFSLGQVFARININANPRRDTNLSAFRQPF